MAKRAKLEGNDIFFSREEKDVKKESRDAVMTASHQDVKEKVTLYFSDETIKAIETAKFNLRMEHGVKTSNSALVEAAVNKAVSDMSSLARLLKK